MKKIKGFTLIELTVVIVVIGILGIIITLAIKKNENNKITQGTVVSKDYTPARASSKSYTPETFTITIEDGKIVEYTFNVPESEYTMYNVGDWYPKER